MIGALIYLHLASLKNAARQHVLRLRSPRYLLGALVGIAYCYFLFFRHRHEPAPELLLIQGGTLREWIEPLVVLLAAGAGALTWLLPNSRAELAFSEAEVAHLFPAPVGRRTLINFKLIKSQLTILFSTVVITLISDRWALFGGNPWLHAIGWWLLCSTYNLHMIGASFARQRLFAIGVGSTKRQLIVALILALLATVAGMYFVHSLPAPSVGGNDDVRNFLVCVTRFLNTAPVSWALWPVRIIVGPFLARDTVAFLHAAGPAMLLLVVHYLWVMWSDVAFEEASVELAQKKSEASAAARSGKTRGMTPQKKRREPFALPPSGWPSLAFLWKGLLAAGPLYYPQYWLVAGALLCGGEAWLGQDPAYRPLVGAILAFCLVVGGYGLFLGPVLARRGLALMLQRMDVTKTYPLQGWQIVLGELLCPVVIFCVFEWIILSLLLLAVYLMQDEPGVTAALVTTGWLCSWLLLVPLSALLFALNYAGALYFPGWVASALQPGGGLEKIGHRLIFFAGYLAVLAVVLLPALLVGSLPVLVCLYFDLPAVAVATGSLMASIVLFAELASAVWWLGRRFEQFDLSVELKLA